MSATSTLPTWLAAAIHSLATGDVDGWMKIYAADAVHEFPLAPEDRPHRLDGRAAIAAYMTEAVKRVRFGSFSNFRVREAGDEVIVEAEGHHHRIGDDAPLDLSYIWFITVRDGLVTHFRDYMNRLQPTTR